MSIDTYGGIGAGWSRRSVIGAFGALGTLMFTNPARSIAHACRMIVDADEGPFYPVVPIPENNDLTFVSASSARASGEPIFMFGRVVGPLCTPVSGATIEIWQADEGGQYVHPRAPKVKALDPNFHYFASVRSGSDGFYRFRTIRPMPYSFFGLRRAPHIHIRVKASGFATMTSELYFAGSADEALRANDRVFRSRGDRRNEMVVAGRSAQQVRELLRAGSTSGAEQCFEYELTVRKAT